MTRQQNHPNWFQGVSVYRPGEVIPVEDFTIEQVWDGSLAGHRRLRRACLEKVEEMRDATRLHYVLWPPVRHGGVNIPLADRQHIEVS